MDACCRMYRTLSQPTVLLAFFGSYLTTRRLNERQIRGYSGANHKRNGQITRTGPWQNDQITRTGPWQDDQIVLQFTCICDSLPYKPRELRDKTNGGTKQHDSFGQSHATACCTSD